MDVGEVEIKSKPNISNTFVSSMISSSVSPTCSRVGSLTSLSLSPSNSSSNFSLITSLSRFFNRSGSTSCENIKVVRKKHKKYFS